MSNTTLLSRPREYLPARTRSAADAKSYMIGRSGFPSPPCGGSLRGGTRGRAPPLRRGCAAPRGEPHPPIPPREERGGENPASRFPGRRQYRDPSAITTATRSCASSRRPRRSRTASSIFPRPPTGCPISRRNHAVSERPLRRPGRFDRAGAGLGQTAPGGQRNARMLAPAGGRGPASADERAAASIKHGGGHHEDQHGKDAVESILAGRQPVGEGHAQDAANDSAGNELASDVPIDESG